MNQVLETEQSIIISIDLHFNSAYIVEYDVAKRTIVRKDLKRHPKGGRPLRRLIKRVLDKVEQRAVVIIESGPTTRALIEYLHEHGFDARMVEARAAARFRQGKHADDWNDAETVARAYSAGLVRDLFFPDREFHELRKMNRTRINLRQDITKQTLKYQSHVLEMTGERFHLLSLLMMTNNTLEHILGNSHALRTAIELRTQIILLMRREMDLKKCVNRGMNQYRSFHLLKTIPGVGNALAATIVLESGDISTFKGSSAYASYCGLASGVSTSNGRIKGINCAQGNSQLKWAFSMVARNAFRDKSIAGATANAFLQKKFSGSDNELKAYQALALRLCKSAFLMMKQQQSFNTELCFGFSFPATVND